MAAVYGNQQAIGEAFKTLFDNGEVKREDLFITSKLWLTHCTPEDYDEMLTQTLSDLGLSYLDLYLVSPRVSVTITFIKLFHSLLCVQIHFPFFLTKDAGFPPEPHQRKGYSREAYKALWHKLEEEVKNGRVKHIGTSNMSVPKMKNLLEDCNIKPANNQIELHPYLQQNDVVKFCQDNGITVTAYSPLGSPDRPDFCVKEDHKPLMENKVVEEVAKKHGCSNAQVLIRWAIHRKTAVIPKSVTPSRIQQNIEALNVKLDDDDLKKLAGINEHVSDSVCVCVDCFEATNE